ncbi:MAG: class I SAM-dependent methyltransferase [Acidimicrobiales bacterium]
MMPPGEPEAAAAHSAALYELRHLAESFGEDAALYDRARPSYPAALVDDLLVTHPVVVLDVGCGTGKVSRLFVERGCDVLGIEVDPRMAAFAHSTGLAVEISRFEAWDPGGRTFDLLVSGQAWHWVEPRAGAQKASAAIRSGGHFAVFWNHQNYPEAVQQVITDVYSDLAPEILANSHFLGTSPRLPPDEPTADPAMTALLDTGDFDSPERRQYRWERHYAVDEWTAHLRTVSDHRQLSEDRLTGLVAALEERLNATAAPVFVTFDTDLLTAVRR